MSPRRVRECGGAWGEGEFVIVLLFLSLGHGGAVEQGIEDGDDHAVAVGLAWLSGEVISPDAPLVFAELGQVGLILLQGGLWLGLWLGLGLNLRLSGRLLGSTGLGVLLILLVLLVL